MADRPHPVANKGPQPRPAQSTPAEPGGGAGGSAGHHQAGAKASGAAEGGTGTDFLPGAVWQLAYWALTPAADADAQLSREQAVRALLLKLIDDLVPE